jgi:hypothetical protein
VGLEREVMLYDLSLGVEGVEDHLRRAQPNGAFKFSTTSCALKSHFLKVSMSKGVQKSWSRIICTNVNNIM